MVMRSRSRMPKWRSKLQRTSLLSLVPASSTRSSAQAHEKILLNWPGMFGAAPASTERSGVSPGYHGVVGSSFSRSPAGSVAVPSSSSFLFR